MRPDELTRRDLVLSGGSALANVRRGADEDLIEWARESGRFLYVGRRILRRPDLGPSSPWANPFKGERDSACVLFAAHLASRPDLLARLPELRGRLLGCWCHPARCHGDELLRALGASR